MTTSPQLPADLFVQPFNDCVLLETIEHLQRQLSLSLAWQRIRVSVELPAGEKAGLCANILLCDPLAFQPFPVQFHANAQKRLQQDTALQESIAHAYWQTCWASGAIRASRGETEPVAFVAVDRSQSFSPTPDPDEFQRLSETHVIFGREAMMLHPLRQTPAQTIWWDNGQFTGGADPDLLAWLNRHAFADRYVAQNRKLPARFAIKRFVPVSGSHTISALLQSELDHFRDPHWHSSRSSVLAAINGGFFLNFPEEYQHPWCAMNDPVGMMILGGCIRQLPLVARGEVLAFDRGGPVVAPMTGRLLMPLYQQQGSDGFFVVRDVRRPWLVASSVLRRAGGHLLVRALGARMAEEELHFDRPPGAPARALLVLLGYRRQELDGQRLRAHRLQEPRRRPRRR